MAESILLATVSDHRFKLDKRGQLSSARTMKRFPSCAHRIDYSPKNSSVKESLWRSLKREYGVIRFPVGMKTDDFLPDDFT
jgi:hypothetical protein